MQLSGDHVLHDVHQRHLVQEIRVWDTVQEIGSASRRHAGPPVLGTRFSGHWARITQFGESARETARFLIDELLSSSNTCVRIREFIDYKTSMTTF